MDISDKKLWEGIILALFLLFAGLASMGGILSSFCYLAPEPAKCIPELSLPINAVSISFGIIVFIIALWWFVKKK